MSAKEGEQKRPQIFNPHYALMWGAPTSHSCFTRSALGGLGVQGSTSGFCMLLSSCTSSG